MTVSCSKLAAAAELLAWLISRQQQPICKVPVDSTAEAAIDDGLASSPMGATAVSVCDFECTGPLLEGSQQ